MSLLFMEGWESVPSGGTVAYLNSRWGQVAEEGGIGDITVDMPGRGGWGQYLRMHNTTQAGAYMYAERFLGAQTSLVVGLGLRWNRSLTPNTWEIFLADTTQTAYRYDFLAFGWPEDGIMHTNHRLNLGFRVVEGNYIALFTSVGGGSFNAVEVARSPIPLVRDGIWDYFEFKFNTGGDLVVRVNNDEVWNAHDLQLNTFGNGYPYMYLGHIAGKGWYPGLFGLKGMFPSWRYDYDDVYVAAVDGQGVTDFAGDVTVVSLKPNAPGALTQWAPFPASLANWDAVNDAVPDDDATNVTADLLNATDTYTLEALTAPGAILSVQISMVARRYWSSYTQVAPLLRLPPGITAVGNALDAPGDYTSLTTAYDVNPFTGSGWTPTDLADTQFGMKIVR